MSNDDLHLMTGAYVLDSLDDLERAAFERHLATCDPCSAEVVELRAAVTEIGAAQFTAAPSQLREAVFEQVGRTAQLPPHAPAASPTRKWTKWVSAVAVAAVAVGAFALGSVMNQRAADERLAAEQAQITQIMAAPDAQMVSMKMSGGAHSSVVVSRQQGKALLTADDIAEPQGDSVYQLWLIDDRGAKHGMETFRPQPDGDTRLMIDGDFTTAAALAVTVEPPGGSQQPTTDPVGVAELA